MFVCHIVCSLGWRMWNALLFLTFLCRIWLSLNCTLRKFFRRLVYKHCPECGPFLNTLYIFEHFHLCTAFSILACLLSLQLLLSISVSSSWYNAHVDLFYSINSNTSLKEANKFWSGIIFFCRNMSVSTIHGTVHIVQGVPAKSKLDTSYSETTHLFSLKLWVLSAVLTLNRLVLLNTCHIFLGSQKWNF